MPDAFAEQIGKLRAALSRFRPGNTIYDEIVGTREEVFARYRPIFCPEYIPAITHEEFTSFLYFENNRHWSGLYRQGLGAASDMPKLRISLGILLDETRPIRERFPEALGLVKGLGKAIATGILTVAYPDRYGVWNNTSEAAMREAGIFPTFDRGDGLGGRYERINNLLGRVAAELEIDLWTLDALWWYILESDRLPQEAMATKAPPVESVLGGSFALEKQLESFLLENWAHTPLAQDWEIYATPDEPEAGGQFPTDVGRIDILARHKRAARFLVIELKRHQTGDQTVGQALRYMGWVKQHLATNGESVEALIIARQADKTIPYALDATQGVSMMTYEVEFRLKELEATWGR